MAVMGLITQGDLLMEGGNAVTRDCRIDRSFWGKAWIIWQNKIDILAADVLASMLLMPWRICCKIISSYGISHVRQTNYKLTVSPIRVNSNSNFKFEVGRLSMQLLLCTNLFTGLLCMVGLVHIQGILPSRGKYKDYVYARCQYMST